MKPNRKFGHNPLWSHLGAGFFCFKSAQNVKLPCFSASTGHQVYGCPLHATETDGILDIILKPSFHKAFVPISLMLDAAAVPDTTSTQVYRLEWDVVEVRADRVSIRIVGAELVKPSSGSVRARRHSGAGTDACEDADMELPDLALEHVAKLDALGQRDSDCESLCDSEDTEIDSQCEDTREEDIVAAKEDGSDSDVETHVAKPKGRNVVYSNGYFTFTNNPDFPDVKVTVVPRWCEAGLLGTSLKSKTVVPGHFGEARSTPTRSLLVLRAWMLQKAKFGNFCDSKSSRRRLFADEARKLRTEIVAMSSEKAPSTGNALADSLIRDWAPAVLGSTA
jgi:hypothetical protein